MNPLSAIRNNVSSVSIEVTTCCPLNCIYCERKIHNKTMRYEEFLKFRDVIHRDISIERVTFCGIGETFLHKDIYRMLEELKDYKITLITSGTILIDFELLARYNNIDIIILSIDAISREKVMDICGETYNYDNLIANIEGLKEYNKKARKTRNYISSNINCTINKNNIQDIVEMVEYAFQNKFTSIHFSLPWGNYPLIEENYSYLTEQFLIAKKKADRYGIYMEDPFNSFCCITHDHIMPYIDVNGNYYYCGYGLHKKEILGNIYINSIETIRQNPLIEEYHSGKRCSQCDMTEFCNLARSFAV